MGIDVADSRRIGRLLHAHGTRFTQRWFATDEISECEASPDRARAYTARFAAKEAVWKSLQLSGGTAVPWRSIVVLEHGVDGRTTVTLHGEVAAAATRDGVGPIRVSWSSDADLTTAVALAERASS